MMGWNWDGGTWLGMGAGMLLWIVLSIVVVWLVVRGLMLAERGRTSGPTESPDDILRARFARGEIDAEEYQRRLTLLHSK